MSYQVAQESVGLDGNGSSHGAGNLLWETLVEDDLDASGDPVARYTGDGDAFGDPCFAYGPGDGYSGLEWNMYLSYEGAWEG